MIDPRIIIRGSNPDESEPDVSTNATPILGETGEPLPDLPPPVEPDTYQPR